MSIIDRWFSEADGLRLDPDGHYGNQCVDVVDHYAEYIFGVPWQESVGGVAGAKDLLDVAPDEYWVRFDYQHGFIPERGDVLVFGGDKDNPWGHTAPTASADRIGINVLQQDGFAAPHQYVDGNWYSAKAAHRARLAYSAPGTGALKGVLRPRPEKFRSTITHQSITTHQVQEDDMPLTDDDINRIADGVLRRKVQKDGGGEAMLIETVASYNAVHDWQVRAILDGVAGIVKAAPGVDAGLVQSALDKAIQGATITFSAGRGDG